MCMFEPLFSSQTLVRMGSRDYNFGDICHQSFVPLCLVEGYNRPKQTYATMGTRVQPVLLHFKRCFFEEIN